MKSVLYKVHNFLDKFREKKDDDDDDYNNI